MIKLSKIELRGMEGRTEWGNEIFTSFAAFQSHMRWVAREAMKDYKAWGREWLGYFKSDVVLTWEDGETYEARYDLGKDGLSDGETLGEHIKHYAEFHLGIRKPAHLKPEQYQRFVSTISEEEKKSFRDFLASYELCDKELGVRHGCNVMHVDFEGHKHPVNTTCPKE